jgi:hypothetical protein
MRGKKQELRDKSRDYTLTAKTLFSEGVLC